VLVEAMVCGRAVVSFDCPSGPGEIIGHGHDGLLVKSGDVKGLAAALGTLMDNPDLRERLGRSARQLLDRFSVEQVMEQWNRLINEVITGETGIQHN